MFVVFCVRSSDRDEKSYPLEEYLGRVYEFMYKMFKEV